MAAAEKTVSRARLGLHDVLRNEADMAFRRRVRTVFDFLTPSPEDRILDAGCGHGFYLRALDEICGASAIGVEARGAWIAQGQQELAGSGSRLVRGDVCQLPFAAGCFDKVILSEVLEHVQDDLLVLSEARRVLRPGGLIAVTVPHADYPLLWDPVNKLLEKGLGMHLPAEPLWLGGIWADHVRLYGEREIVERIHASGFQILEIRRLTHYCLPFAHHLLYGLGKSLLLSGWLPPSLRDSVDRFRYREGARRRSRLVSGLLRALAAIDARNDRPEAHVTYLNVAVKAVRP
jgi:SAM-dependent methyltransferase